MFAIIHNDGAGHGETGLLRGRGGHIRGDYTPDGALSFGLGEEDYMLARVRRIFWLGS